MIFCKLQNTCVHTIFNMNYSITQKIRELIRFDPQICDNNFVNELETSKYDLYEKYTFYQMKIIKKIVLNGCSKKTEEIDEQVISSVENAKKFTGSYRKDLRVAARGYTSALDWIPEGSATAALARADRAVVLQDLGYSEAAYDDFIIALQCPEFPEDLRAKIIYYQALMAREFGDAKALRKHIQELQMFFPEDYFNYVITPLQFSAMAFEINENMETSAKRNVQESLNNEVEIVETPGNKCRSMIAKKNFKKGEQIFQDTAFVVLPDLNSQICSNCAEFMIIPFNCFNCKGIVVYCSLKCKEEHLNVHKYECKLLMCDRHYVENATILVLRMLLKGIQQILPILKSKLNAESFWAEIFDQTKHDDIEYVKVLKSPTMWELSTDAKLELKEKRMLTKFLLTYLKFATDFFNYFDETTASRNEWSLFIYALILRHYGQVEIGTHATLSSLDHSINLLSKDLKLGELVTSTGIYVTCFYYFPFKNICNHSCEKTIDIEINRKSLTAIAHRNIKKGEDVTATYAWLDIFESSTKYRQQLLKTNYFFDCQCMKCESIHPEDVFFFLFYCKNQKCKQFTYTLDNESSYLECPKCERLENLNIPHEKTYLANLCYTRFERRYVFERLKYIDKYFFGLSAPLASIYQHILRHCVASHFVAEKLKPKEIRTLKCMSKYAIEVFNRMKASSVLKMRLMGPYMELLAIQKIPLAVSELKDCLCWIQELPDAELYVYMSYFERILQPLIK